MIPQSALKLYQSQEMDDTDEGGGIQSGTVIPDNQVNNIFPNISRLDRTYSRINLRKVFAQVDTATTDTYSGAHFIVADGPLDPRVFLTLFSTDDYNDQRSAARNYVESYVIGGPVSEWRLYEDQLPGQRQILAFGALNATIPNVGAVLLLSTEATGFAANQQYVRVSSVDVSVRSFNTAVCHDFQQQVITIGLSDALRYRFYGESPTCFSDVVPPTLLRTTIPADTANYFGITALTVAASVGDLNITVGSIYSQLVPSITVEAPVANAQAGALAQTLVPAGVPITVSNDNGHGLPFPQYAARSMSRGLCTVNGNGVFPDDSNGNLVGPGNTVVGTVDYVNGTIAPISNGGNDFAYSYSLTFTPAAAITPVANTLDVPITLSNRGFNYVLACTPIPAPGSMVVSYRAQSRWYTLRDQGDGTLVGDSVGFGTGTVDFETGDVIVTLGALPDVGTSVLSSWGTPAHYKIRTGDLTFNAPQVRGTVQHAGIAPSSVTFTWTVGGVTKTATDDGNGNLTGDGTGSVVYATGDYALSPNTIQDAGSGFSVGYTVTGALSYQDTLAADGSGNISFTLAGAPIKTKSVNITTYAKLWTYSQYNQRAKYQVVDDGAGGFKRKDTGEVVSGSINYTTGAVTLNVQPQLHAPVYNPPFGYILAWVIGHSAASGIWANGMTTSTYDVASGVTVNYMPAAAGSPTHYTENVAAPALTVDLSPHTLEAIVPGSVDFLFAGHRYVDRQGLIYRDINPDNNSGTQAGTIDYTTGLASLTDYVAGANTLTVRSLLTQYGNPTVWQYRFRTPGAPVRPASLFVRAVKARDGGQITATVDVNGNIVSADMQGTIDQENGIVRIDFGRMVLDSSLTTADKAEWWYNAANIDGTGHIFRPHEVLPETVKFNCVVFSSVPVDADLLGLDPVRLPQDGRVPMIRNGNVLVVMNTKPYTLPNPVVLGHTYNLGRTDLASIALRDSVNALVADTLYTVDLDTGDFAFNSGADLSGYAQPITVYHRVEDMVRAGDVQINGQIQLAGALSHDYTSGDTLVASALLIGDLQARAYNLFTQAVWLNHWLDSQEGTGTVGQYDIGDYPIAVENRGAIKQRWRLYFTSTTAFQVIGETRGQVATGDTGHDCAPINPATGTPFFTILAGGWSAGWQPGNVVRFNTDGANYPIWMARTIVSGPKTEVSDSAQVEFRGDA